MKILRGPLTAIIGAFPAAALVGLVYGFPIPFDSKRHGINAVLPSFIAVVFYGLLGGFVVLALLGWMAGRVAAIMSEGDLVKEKRLTMFMALGASLLCTIFLSVLDLLIGPW